MSQGLTRSQVGTLLQDLQKNRPEADCCTCDCFQGFLTQLELDAAEDVADLVGPLKVPASRMHGCLGCDPCPPGSAFATHPRGLARQTKPWTCGERDCDGRMDS